MALHRHTTVTTSLGESALLFRRMVGNEHLGRPFEYQLELAGSDEQIKFEDLLGQSVTVKVALAQGGTRYFNGLVSRFSQTGRVGPHVLYRATLRPWLSFLTRTSNCRIFQDKTAVDIIKTVFRDRGFTDFDEKLSGAYSTMTYCVQYRESDFNFVSRLMEHEGIYYYFRHEEGKHTLVLSDAYSSHDAIPGYETIPYYPPAENVVRDEDHIWQWDISKEVQSGAFALNDFDFEKPRAGLFVKSSSPRSHPLADYEVYDYPGDYLVTGQGNAYVDSRLQELQAQYEEVRGQGNPGGLLAGGLFKLAEYPRDDQNREYLVVSVDHDVRSEEYRSGGGAPGGAPYACGFSAIDSHQVYRPPRLARRPFVQGPQTAVVVGKSGEEIWTDKYGRVKVQFHWDREGKNDENSSCWVRVAQVWAGKNWGAIQIPRIGQEVIVDFLEGDPDRPIITGRVYNADNMPPYDLPGNATQSGIKSRSSKGGGSENFNEIRFEDKKGEEQMYIHAEKDQVILVENDQTREIGHDQTLTVGHNRDETIKNNRALVVGVNKSESVGANKTVTVGANHSEQITANMSLTVGSTSTEAVALAKALTIGAAYQITVGAAMNTTVGGSVSEEVGLFRATTVGGNSTENVGGKKDISVGANLGVTVGKSLAVSAKDKSSIAIEKDLDLSSQENLNAKATKKIVISADDEITLVAGKAQITLKKDGTIELKGGKIKVNGDSDVKIKGSKISLN